jgi:glycosyltransferase involved in cell wall biosynthesis
VDAVAVTLRPRVDTHTVPSKIYEAMASRNPVLLSADGAPAQILAESEAGLASAAGDVRGLVDNIADLRDDSELARRLGENGCKYASHYDRRVLVDRLEELLLRVARESHRKR